MSTRVISEPRAAWKVSFGWRTQFDPAGFVIQQKQRLESPYAKAIRDVHRTRSVIERAACYRLAAHVLGQITTRLQDVGVVEVAPCA
jgi:hypothetical protein